MSKPYYTRLRNRLIAIIERSLAKYDIVECHSGMALGADIVWAQAIVYCKEKYGSDKIKFVAEIPDYIKELYKTVWEIKMKNIIDMSADRGAYICQSQSLNLFINAPNTSKLTSMHFYAWKKGLKISRILFVDVLMTIAL